MPFKVTPSMIMDTVYPWLEMYTNKEASLCLVKQKLQFELAMMGVSFWDDLWMDILEHIAMSPTGWQDVQVVWQNVKSSDSAQAPTLLDDLRAWCFIQAWAYGQANFAQVGDMMDTVFGEWFVQEEWEDIFDPMYQMWVQLPPFHRSVAPSVGQQPPHMVLQIFKEGMKDETLSENNDDSAEAGSSKLSQDSDGSTNTESSNISQEGNAKVGPLRVSQKGYNSVEARQKISQKWTWPESPQQASATVGPSKAPHKQQKTDDG
ncbi:hypothetical protein J3A83DRAFT_4194308 [Scleroderma citrinum]